MIQRLALALLAMFLTATCALAQPAMRVRGVVEAVDAKSFTLRTPDEIMTVALREGWRAGGLAKASLDEIKPGVFIGVGARPMPDGTLRAIQITLFPEAMRGTGEGHRAWAALPETTMTNATVSETVAAVDGPALTLKYEGGEKKVAIPPDAAILKIVPATQADLKPGVSVSVAVVKVDQVWIAWLVSILAPDVTLPY